MGYFLSSEEIRTLRRIFDPRIQTYAKGETVLHEIPEQPQIGLMLSGTVLLCAENELFERSILGLFTQGDCFPCSLIEQTHDNVTYFQAKYPSTVAFIPWKNLLEFCITSPQWQKTLFLLLDSHLGPKNLSQNFILHQRSIRSRLLYFFREQALRQQSNTIRVPIPFSDLAEFLAVERTAMMRELRRMKEDGLIEGKQRSLTLLCPTGISHTSLL